MSTLKALLKDVPVEWKTLGEVSTIMRGASPRPIAKYITDDENGVPWIKIGDTSPNSKYVISTSQKITHQGALQSRVLEVGDFIISNSMSYGRPYILSIKGAIHDGWAAISNYQNVLEPEFLYFYLSSGLVQNFWHSKINSGSVSNLNADIIRSLPIPIIAKTIQQEIVRVLDGLSEQNKALTTALTQEIDQRKKQYEYYREELFRFEGKEVEWKTLGEIFEFKNGINKGKEFFGKGDKIINYTDVFRNSKIFEENILGKVETTESDIQRFNCRRGDVFFTRTSETKDEIGFASVLLSDIDICVFSGFLIRARPLTNLLFPEYCSYCFATDLIRKKIISSSNMTTRVTTTGSILAKIEIPIPSIQEQERIVHLLDQFDEATKNIVAQLEKEIELRNKQYEYYRNLLLSFPKETN